MNEKDKGRLIDVITFADEAIEHLGALSQTAFLDDRTCQRACERCLELVGEAAGAISDETRAASAHIPWRALRGMRNVLIHQYGSVDLTIIYTTIVNELPTIITQVKTLLQDTQTP